MRQGSPVADNSNKPVATDRELRSTKLVYWAGDKERVVLIYVHSYDIFDAGITWTRHARQTVNHITLGQRDTLRDMSLAIQSTARSHRSIWNLIFNAHGLVDSIHERPTGQLSMSDRATLEPSTAHFLEGLKPFFSPGGRGIEIHGCAILGARAGWRLCHMLSEMLEVSVYASSFDQRGVSPWWSSTPSDRRGRFEHGVMAFRPDGTEENAVNELRALDLFSS